MAGLRAVDAKGFFDVDVACEGPLAKPPQSCFLDGVQSGTGATLGKRNLRWVQGDHLIVRIKNTRSGKSAELRPTPALVSLLAWDKPVVSAGKSAEDSGHRDHVEALARNIAAMPDQEILTVTTIAEARTK